MIPVDYIVSSTDAASNAVVVGSQWTTSSFIPSNQLIRVSIPAGFEERWEMGTKTYTPQVSANSSTARLLKHFPTGTTVTPSVNQVTIAGGKDRSDVNFYNLNTCVTPYNLFTIPTRSSSATIYMKSLATGPMMLNLSAEKMYEVETSVNIPSFTFGSGPFSINPSPYSGSLTANSAATFRMSGGSPPFTVTGGLPANVASASVTKSAGRLFLKALASEWTGVSS